MQIVTAVFVYFLWWWIVLFAVLPIGNKVSANPQRGNEESAPVDPKLKKKFILTSIIALFFWGVTLLLVNSGFLGRVLDIGNM